MRGKGNKERIAYIDVGAAEAMGIWLTARGDEPDPLFCPTAQRGEVVIRHITDQAVYSILQTRAIKAKVRPFSPHDLRRSCVSDLLDAGGSTSQSSSSSSAVPTSPRLPGMTGVVSTPRREQPNPCTYRSWSTSNGEGRDEPCHGWPFSLATCPPHLHEPDYRWDAARCRACSAY